MATTPHRAMRFLHTIRRASQAGRAAEYPSDRFLYGDVIVANACKRTIVAVGRAPTPRSNCPADGIPGEGVERMKKVRNRLPAS